ncbi:tetratricopeptide repeat protein [Parafrankia sp. FMc6]|uniref:tetratricopeptide repeat protein n=1 Tax=Parafrankia soli TaxID=2599596 RepID=UPI0034D407F0
MLLSALARRARLLTAVGTRDEARALLAEMVATRWRVPGAGHPDTAQARTVLTTLTGDGC